MNGLSDVRAFERLLRNGAPESEVDRFLNELSPRIDADPLTKVLVQGFSNNGTLRDQLPFLAELYTKGIAIDRRPGSRVAFIFFSGILDYVNAANAHSRLCRINANCIYLYDETDMNYQFGVRPCGSDVGQTYAALIQHVRDLGADRVITVGCSAGGFAAIKYALALNAYASVTFSPFTSFTEEHQKRDGRGKTIVDRFRKTAPDLLIDLLPLLAKRDPPLKLACFYPKDMPQDAWHAERLQGLRDSFTIAVNRKTHNVFWPVVASGVFDTFMRPLADGLSLENSMALIRSGAAQARQAS